jgi:hypothetical protein
MNSLSHSFKIFIPKFINFESTMLSLSLRFLNFLALKFVGMVLLL